MTESDISVAARVLAEKLAPRLGQAVVVENKPGAGALLGAGAVARATPDGHTLLLTPNTLAISPHVLAAGAVGHIDVQKDLVPVIAPATTPLALVADMGLLLEYSRDSRNDEATTLLQNDLFFGMRLAFNDMQGTEILFGYVQDLAHQASAMGFIEGSRRLGEAWTLTLDVRTFAGRDPNELLYCLRQDDYVAISLDYYF